VGFSESSVAAVFGLACAVCASCAALSGIADYSECQDCEGSSKSPSTVSDATTPGSPPMEEASTNPPPPDNDASEGQSDVGVPPDAAALDVFVNPTDAQPDGTSPPPVDSGPDSIAPVVDAATGPGPTCGPLASRSRCSGSQICCANLGPQTNSCTAASSCASNATLACSTASDCPGSSPICCAHMTTVPDAAGDLPPKCTATGLSASCAATCSDNPPSDATTCKYPPSGTGTVRLCSHDSDCTSDTATTGGGCYNFNGAPVSWCSTALAGVEGVQQF
jgi:hypothetical protein